MMRNAVLPLALLSLSWAGCIMDPEADAAFAEAAPIIGAAIALSIAVAALAYAAGSFMKDPRMLVFSKDQLFQTFISILLVMFIQGIFYGTCMFASEAAGGEDMHSTSVNYLRELRVDGGIMLTQIMRKSIEYKFDATYFVGYQVPFVGGETFWLDAHNNAYARHLEILFDIVMVGYVSAGMQYYALILLPQLALGVMVPLGIVLRTIPKGRDSGNIVLALALALYVVFPFTYTVHSSMMDTEVPWYTGIPDDTGISFEDAAKYVLQTVFLPNLSLVVFATAAGGLIKVAKVLP